MKLPVAVLAKDEKVPDTRLSFAGGMPVKFKQRERNHRPAALAASGGKEEFFAYNRRNHAVICCGHGSISPCHDSRVTI
jgi:hypothetical protein